MKVESIAIGENIVELIAGEYRQRFAGHVDYSVTITRDGRMHLNLSVAPPLLGDGRLRPSTPPRNER